ncbi:MAG: four helix bundle protein [Phycisphaerales bacterium]|nr:four helix bundle protein [Phycisphaerales bacterium]
MRLEGRRPGAKEGESEQGPQEVRAFELADDLVIKVYDATRGFPREELFGLVSQMRRAAYSAPANIVEGCGRNSTRDCVHFLDNALASLRELGYFIGLSQRLGFLSPEVADNLQQHQDEASRVLAGLIRARRRDATDGRP